MTHSQLFVGLNQMLLFFKQDGKPVVTDASHELRDRNQSLIIKVVQPEHEGVFSCLVQNELGKDQFEGNLTIAGRNIKQNRLDISYKNKYLVNSTNTRFLGTSMDSSLSWKNHIDRLMVKLNKARYAIRSLRPFVSYESLRMITILIFVQLCCMV
jgi:hypothetical protein